MTFANYKAKTQWRFGVTIQNSRGGIRGMAQLHQNATKAELVAMIEAQDAQIDDLRPKAESLYALRFGLGIAGMFLPFWLIIGGAFHGGIAPTLSDFYHSAYRDVFVGNLIAIGVFMLVYRGNAKRDGEWISDFWLSTICGASALGVALLPNEHGLEAASQLVLGKSTKYVHILCAFLFFGCLIVFCLSKFRSADDPQSSGYFQRCGLIILVCLVLIFPVGAVRSVPGCLTDDAPRRVVVSDCDWSRRAPAGVTRFERDMSTKPLSDYSNWQQTLLSVKTDYVMRWNLLFWLEAIGVWAFALAWLEKARRSKEAMDQRKWRVWAALRDTLSPPRKL